MNANDRAERSARDKEIVRLYEEERLSTVTIGQRFSMRPETVRQILLRNDVTMRPRRVADPKKEPLPNRRVFSSAADLPAEEIIDQYKAGASLAAIAKSHSTSPTTVRRLLDDNNVERRSRHWKLGKGDKSPRRGLRESLPAEQIISEYKGGSSLAKLAEAYGVSATAIGNLLKAHGVERRSSRDVPWQGRSRVLTDEQEQEVVRLYRQGQAKRKIARDLGVSHPVVDGVLRRRGLTPQKATGSQE